MNTNTNNIYRDVTMDNISEKNVGETVRIAGWIENIRDHGGVSLTLEICMELCKL